jgi:hypothetical protein
MTGRLVGNIIATVITVQVEIKRNWKCAVATVAAVR